MAERRHYFQMSPETYAKLDAAYDAKPKPAPQRSAIRQTSGDTVNCRHCGRPLLSFGRGLCSTRPGPAPFGGDDYCDLKPAKPAKRPCESCGKPIGRNRATTARSCSEQCRQKLLRKEAKTGSISTQKAPAAEALLESAISPMGKCRFVQKTYKDGPHKGKLVGPKVEPVETDDPFVLETEAADYRALKGGCRRPTFKATELDPDIPLIATLRGPRGKDGAVIARALAVSSEPAPVWDAPASECVDCYLGSCRECESAEAA